MNTEEFVQNTVSRTLSKYDERFSTVAESGSYSDLSDKPTIPEAYDDTALASRVTANETAIADRYTKAEADALLDGKASLQVAAIPGGGGGEEINALVSQGENSVSVSYYKDGALPNTLNFNVDSDYFTIPATGYVDEKAAQAQSNAQTYADLKLTQKQNKITGGTTGQALIKQSDTDGDFDWADTGVGVHIKVGEEKWQGTYTDENNETFQVYSKMVYIPALPATAGITTYDHGVANIKQILNIYGFTTDGFVLNAPRQNAQDNIAIYQASKSASNQTFSIEVGKDRSNKAAYVVMVYAKNN